MKSKGFQPEEEKNQRDYRISFFNIERLGWLILALGILLLIIWAGLIYLRVTRLVDLSTRGRLLVTSALDKEIEDIDAKEAVNLATKLHYEMLQLEKLIDPVVSISPLLGWVPYAGSLMENAPEFLDMAVSGSEIGYYLARGLHPAIEKIQLASLEDAWMSNVLPEIVRNQEYLGKASESASRLGESRAKLKRIDELPGRIQNLLTQFDNIFQPANKAILAIETLSEIMEVPSVQTYLVLAQNEDELRPTGGFISGAGLLEVSQERFQLLSFGNAYLVDDLINKAYEEPPEAYKEYLGMDIFLFRDANFWPDFPTSARQAMDLYTHGQNRSIDGVIAFDQRFIEMLVEATGPVEVIELDRTLAASNVINEMRDLWGPSDGNPTDSFEWIGLRKDFMEPLAKSIQEKILDEPNLPELARTFYDALEERHLQIYTNDSRTNQLLQQLNWSGNLSVKGRNDFLSIIDTNLGFNKVNGLLNRKLRYVVSFGEDGQGQAQLFIEYNNQGSIRRECDHGTAYTVDTRYEDLMSDCYWNYLRVYVPRESKLKSSSQHPIPAQSLLSSIDWDGLARNSVDVNGEFSVFENMILVPVGETVTVSFKYQLPELMIHDNGGQNRYNLYVRKQAGTRNDPIEILVDLPPGAHIIEHSKDFTLYDNNSLSFSGELETDLSLTIDYGMEE